MNTSVEQLLDLITLYMAKNRVTQAQMARMIGVSPTALSDWFTGKRKAIRRSHVLSILSICDPTRVPVALAPTATATATQESATATASAPTPVRAPYDCAPMGDATAVLASYRKRVLNAIMTADSVDIDARVEVTAIVSSVPVVESAPVALE